MRAGPAPTPWPKRMLGLTLAGLAAWYACFILLGPGMMFAHDELNFIYESFRLPAERRMISYAHGPLFFEIMALLESAGYVVCRALGRVPSLHEYLITLFTHAPVHIGLCRAVTGAAGLLTVLYVFRLASLIEGPWAGALAALLVSTNLTFVAMTTMAKEDGIYWFFMLAAMERTWRAAEGNSLGEGALAGLAASAAFSTKYFGIFAFLLLPLPLLLARRQGLERAARLCAAAAAGAAGGLLMFFPFLLTDTEAVFQSILILSGSYGSSGPGWTLPACLGTHLPNLVGPFVIAAGTWELVRRIRREPPGPVLLLLVPLAQTLFLGMRRGVSLSYYVVPLGISLCILAACMAARVSRTGAGKFFRHAPASLLVLVALASQPFLPGAVKFALLAMGPYTRLQTYEAFSAMAPAGAGVVVNGGITGDNLTGPPIIPAELPPSRGTFTAARREAVRREQGPRYRLKILDYNRPVTAAAVKGYDWLIMGRKGTYSHIELGLDKAPIADPAPPPKGWELLKLIKAFPEEHSHFSPIPTSLDYEEYRGNFIARFWRERAMGQSFSIYRRTKQ